jgi:hypothetical protein
MIPLSIQVLPRIMTLKLKFMLIGFATWIYIYSKPVCSIAILFQPLAPPHLS